jgi:hypothetical protein
MTFFDTFKYYLTGEKEGPAYQPEACTYKGPVKQTKYPKSPSNQNQKDQIARIELVRAGYLRNESEPSYEFDGSCTQAVANLLLKKVKDETGQAQIVANYLIPE